MLIIECFLQYSILCDTVCRCNGNIHYQSPNYLENKLMTFSMCIIRFKIKVNGTSVHFHIQFNNLNVLLVCLPLGGIDISVDRLWYMLEETPTGHCCYYHYAPSSLLSTKPTTFCSGSVETLFADRKTDSQKLFQGPTAVKLESIHHPGRSCRSPLCRPPQNPRV